MQCFYKLLHAIPYYEYENQAETVQLKKHYEVDILGSVCPTKYI